MAKRVEALDCRKWADGFLTRLGRYSQRDRRRKPPPTSRGRGGAAPAPLREGSGADDPARLRRDAARARGPPRPRRSDERDSLVAARPRRASGDGRAHRERSPAFEPREVVRPASDPSVRRARILRAGTGRRVAHAGRARSHLDAPDRAPAAAGRGGRSRCARRAEGGQRRLALPRGGARVRSRGARTSS